MFSRAGKASTYKFKILYEKTEILSRECKSIKPRRAELLSKKLSINEINKLVETERERLSQIKAEVLAKPPHPSSPFIAQSRDEYYERNQKVLDTPAPGWYNLSYNLIDKHSSSPSMRKKLENHSPEHSTDFVPDFSVKSTDSYTHTKAPGMIYFDKQLSRSNFNKLHEIAHSFSNYAFTPNT